MLKVSRLFMVPVLAITAFAWKNDKDPETLIASATEKVNIFALPSFTMKAGVKMENFGNTVNGSYSLFWRGPNQWREEIRFPGYSEITILQNDQLFIKRSSPFVPYRVAQLHATLGFSAAAITLGSFFDEAPVGTEHIRGVHEQKIGGHKADCVEIEMFENGKREVCVDETTGLFNRKNNNFVDENWQPVADKIFPRDLSLDEPQENKPVVQVHVTELGVGTSFQPELFTVPADAISRSGCVNPIHGSIVKKVSPRYPELAKTNRIQGTVVVYFLLDQAGVPQKPQVILGVRELNDSTLDAVRQWRYEPCTCAGKPVTVDSYVEVHYTMQ